MEKEKRFQVFGILCLSNAMFEKRTDMGYDQNEGTATCLECGCDITYGRSGQKYCSRECKNRHNNRTYAYIRNLKLKTQNKLERNYEILSDMLDNRLDSAELWKLETEGFSPEHVTACYRGRGYLQLCCYDISYRMSDTKVYTVRRIQRVKTQTKESV